MNHESAVRRAMPLIGATLGDDLHLRACGTIEISRHARNIYF
jgi:hypothetical protein